MPFEKLLHVGKRLLVLSPPNLRKLSSPVLGSAARMCSGTKARSVFSLRLIKKAD